MYRTVCLFLASLIVFSGQARSEELNAGQILQEIKEKGPRTVIDRFWKDDDDHHNSEDPLVDAIATGKDEWLEVAKQLRPGSGGIVTEELYWAVSVALSKNAYGVLTLLRSDPKNFALQDICRSPFYEDTVDFATDEKFLKDAEKNLVYMSEANEDKEIDALRWQCLEEIRRDLRENEKEMDKAKTGVKEAPVQVIPPSSELPQPGS
jgi:hypothetical protein